MKNLCNSKPTSINSILANASSMLSDRGIKVIGKFLYCNISGRTTEKHLICARNQIVEIDDIPENCEVVYVACNNGTDTEEYSYDSPVFCDWFYAMIFEKRERQSGNKLMHSKRRLS